MSWKLRAAVVALVIVGVASQAEAEPPKDPLAKYIKAAGSVPSPAGPVLVDFLTDGDLAAIRVRRPDKPQPEILGIQSLDEALALLSDRRMEFLWEPLTAWTGPDLTAMRDRMIARLRAAAAEGSAGFRPRTTGESTVRPKIRAIVQLADYLRDCGREKEAEDLLGQQLATMRLKGDWKDLEWFEVAALIASSRWSRGDDQGAIEQYEFIEKSMGDTPFALNATISRASLLVLSRRYEEALTAINSAWTRFAAYQKSGGSGDEVPGSDRQFAWIRACALEGLGRHIEADADMKLLSGDREWHDPDFVIASDKNLRFKALQCMGKPEPMIEALKDQVANSPITGALLDFEPAYHRRRYQQFWDAVMSDPELSKMVAQRMRILPSEMSDALNHWRTVDTVRTTH